MKQYKLIKKYPGSPELGTIVEMKPGGTYFIDKNRQSKIYFLYLLL